MTEENTVGDDLNDGLDYEYSQSEDEGITIESSNEKLDESHEDEDEDENKNKNEDKKENNKVEGGNDSDEEEEDDENPKKRKKSDNLKNKKKQKVEYEVQQKQDLVKESSDVLSEKLATKIRELNPNLSPLELSDLYLKKDLFKYTGDWKTERDLDNLEKFIKYYNSKLIPNLKKIKNNMKKIKRNSYALTHGHIQGKGEEGDDDEKEKKEKKVPTDTPKRKFIVVLSESAIRACDVHRATKNFEGGSLKLITKNLISQDLKLLKTTWSRVLNATPNRLVNLLEAKNSSIKPEEIESIICDCYLDTKMRNIWDTNETFEVIRLIASANPKVKIFLY